MSQKTDEANSVEWTLVPSETQSSTCWARHNNFNASSDNLIEHQDKIFQLMIFFIVTILLLDNVLIL